MQFPQGVVRILVVFLCLCLVAEPALLQASPQTETLAPASPFEARDNAHKTHFLAEAAYKDKDYNKSLELYRRVLALNPKSVPAMLGVARSALALRQDSLWDEADELLKRAIALEPDNLELFNTHAELYLLTEPTPLPAERVFSHVLGLDPKNLRARLGLVAIDIARGDPESLDQAREDLEQLLSEHPSNLDVLEQLTLLYMIDGQHETALSFAIKISALDPSRLEVIRALWEHYHEIDHGDEFLVISALVLRGEQDQEVIEHILEDIAKLFATMGRSDQMIMAREAISSWPDDLEERNQRLEFLGLIPDPHIVHNLLAQSEIDRIVEGFRNLGVTPSRLQKLTNALNGMKGTAWADVLDKKIYIDPDQTAFLAELYRLIGQPHHHRRIIEEGITHEIAELYAARLLQANPSPNRSMVSPRPETEEKFLKALQDADPDFPERFAQEFTSGVTDTIKGHEVLAKFLHTKVVGEDRALLSSHIFSPAIEDAIAKQWPDIGPILAGKTRTARRQKLKEVFGATPKLKRYRGSDRASYHRLLQGLNADIQLHQFQSVQVPSPWGERLQKMQVKFHFHLESAPNSPPHALVLTMRTPQGEKTIGEIRMHRDARMPAVLFTLTSSGQENSQHIIPPARTILSHSQWNTKHLPLPDTELQQFLLTTFWDRFLAYYVDLTTPETQQVEYQGASTPLDQYFKTHWARDRSANTETLLSAARQRAITPTGNRVWNTQRREERSEDASQLMNPDHRLWDQPRAFGYWLSPTQQRIQHIVDRIAYPHREEGKPFHLLDLMTGTRSFVPQGMPVHTTAVGLRADELIENKAAKAGGVMRVQDLIKTPRLPEADDSQDMVTLISGIQYLTNPQAVLRQVHRVLKPGKPILIMGSPNSSYRSAEVQGWGGGIEEISRYLHTVLRSAGFHEVHYIEDQGKFPVDVYAFWAFKPQPSADRARLEAMMAELPTSTQTSEERRPLAGAFLDEFLAQNDHRAQEVFDTLFRALHDPAFIHVQDTVYYILGAALEKNYKLKVSQSQFTSLLTVLEQREKWDKRDEFIEEDRYLIKAVRYALIRSPRLTLDIPTLDILFRTLTKMHFLDLRGTELQLAIEQGLNQTPTLTMESEKFEEYIDALGRMDLQPSRLRAIAMALSSDEALVPIYKKRLEAVSSDYNLNHTLQTVMPMAVAHTIDIPPALASLIQKMYPLSFISFAEQGMDGGGNSKNRISFFSEQVLARIKDRLIPPLPEPLPELDTPEGLAIEALENLDTVVEGYTFQEASGRELIYRDTQGKILILRLQRQPGRRGQMLLDYESRMMDYIHKHAGTLGLRGTYPKTVPIGGKRVVDIKDLSTEAEAALQEQIEKKGVQVAYAAGYYTVSAYTLQDEGYRRYLNDPTLTPEQFWDSSHINLHDMFVLARHGIVHTVPVGLFHNLDANRQDQGRYLTLADIILPAEIERTGSGRLHAWLRAVLFANLRVSGFADFEEIWSLEALLDKQHPLTGHLRLLQEQHPQYKKEVFYLASYLADYLLSWTLMAGSYLRERDELHWENAESTQRLATLMRNGFEEALGAFTGRAGEAPSAAANIVDFERLAKQMAFYMAKGNPYAEHFIEGKIPPEIYELKEDKIEFPKNGVQKAQNWKVTADGQGAAADGQHPDLGMWNSSFWIQELVTAWYTYASFMMSESQRPYRQRTPVRHPSFRAPDLLESSL